MADFKENLRQARLAKGMTQGEVADLIGVAKSTYSLYETGKREPDVLKIKKISKVLEVPADALIGTDDETEIWLTPDDHILLLNYKVLNAEGRRKVREYVRDLFANYKGE